MLTSSHFQEKPAEPAWDRFQDLLGAPARLQSGDYCATLRYLPMHRIGGWDLRYEQGLEQLLYIQNLIEED